MGGIRLLNANYQFLGGTGDLTFDWTLESETVMIESFNDYFPVSGTHMMTSTQPLAPGAYTATITATGFRDLTDSATFEILDCTLPQPDYGLVVYGVSSLCLPGHLGSGGDPDAGRVGRTRRDRSTRRRRWAERAGGQRPPSAPAANGTLPATR